MLREGEGEGELREGGRGKCQGSPLRGFTGSRFLPIRKWLHKKKEKRGGEV